MSRDVYDPEKDLKTEIDFPHFHTERKKENFIQRNRRHMVVFIDIAILAVFSGIFIPMVLNRSRQVRIEDRVFTYKAASGENLFLIRWTITKGEVLKRGEEIMFSYYLPDSNSPFGQDIFKAGTKATEHIIEKIPSGVKELICRIENQRSGEKSEIKVVLFNSE